ncbi:MAG: helix-turn-helix transcriptional regulator [Gordonibacter pamelaeae]
MDLQLMKLRKMAGYRNRDDFAEKLGVNKYTYRSWESGSKNDVPRAGLQRHRGTGLHPHELCGRKPVRSFADPDQAALNGYYESMNERGRSALVESARLMSDGDSVRIEKDGAAHVGISSAMGA